ncbi:MAG: hypothetical protein JWQ44_2751 [Chthoniobacter sp.]|nr:hypothetical protein [Chthoniobacter sp.]
MRRLCREARARSAPRNRRVDCSVRGPIAPATFGFPVPVFTFTLLLMTEAQQQMIDKAFELLSEHFDHVVIAVGTYDEDKQYTTTASYYGGVAPAIGLCKLYEMRWTKEHLWGVDEEQD